MVDVGELESGERTTTTAITATTITATAASHRVDRGSHLLFGSSLRLFFLFSSTLLLFFFSSSLPVLVAARMASVSPPS